MLCCSNWISSTLSVRASGWTPPVRTRASRIERSLSICSTAGLLTSPWHFVIALVVTGLVLAVVRTSSRVVLLGAGRYVGRDLRERLNQHLFVILVPGRLGGFLVLPASLVVLVLPEQAVALLEQAIRNKNNCLARGRLGSVLIVIGSHHRAFTAALGRQAAACTGREQECGKQQNRISHGRLLCGY